MSEKLPLVYYGNDIDELHTGDTLGGLLDDVLELISTKQGVAIVPLDEAQDYPEGLGYISRISGTQDWEDDYAPNRGVVDDISSKILSTFQGVAIVPLEEAHYYPEALGYINRVSGTYVWEDIIAENSYNERTFVIDSWTEDGSLYYGNVTHSLKKRSVKPAFYNASYEGIVPAKFSCFDANILRVWMPVNNVNVIVVI